MKKKKLIFLIAVVFIIIFLTNLTNIRYYKSVFYCEEQQIVMGKDYGTYLEYTYSSGPSWNPIEDMFIPKQFFCTEEDAEKMGYSRSLGIPKKGD